MQENTLDELFTSFESLVRHRCRDLINEILQEELEEVLGTAPYVRGGKGHRNGVRTRQFVTSFGEMEVDVPRARLFDETGQSREYRSRLLPKSKRLTPSVEALMASIYLTGTSTRKVRVALASILGGVSKSSVSRALCKMKPAWQAWQVRDLSPLNVLRVILDGFWINARVAGRAMKVCILISMGILPSGEKAVLSIYSVGAESKEAWKAMLEDLQARGVQSPELAIVDGNAGLLSALSEIWPDTPVQRCTVHKERNLLAYAPEALKEELKEDYRAMVSAPSAQEVLAQRDAFVEKWRPRCPKVVRSLHEAGDSLFTFLKYPSIQWRSIRSTNAIERLNGEYRRRIKVQGLLPNSESVCMMFWAMLAIGAINIRRVDGWQTLQEPTVEIPPAA